MSRVIPTALELLLLPSLPPSPSSPLHLHFLFFPFFLFYFFFFCHQASVREDGCFCPPCARTLSLGICLLLISLANPFPLLAKISPGISKEAVNYVGYSFICSSLQCFKKKKLNTQTKTTVCSCCAATSVRGFLSSLANINEFSLAVSLCRREGLSSLFHSWGN